MATVEDAARCIQELNGVVRAKLGSVASAPTGLMFFSQELNGRRIRVDYSVTERPHQPTPGEYMGLRRSDYGRREDRGRDRRDDRGRYDRERDYDRYDRRDDRDRDYRYSRRSPPSRRYYSPRRRSYSRSPRGSPARYEGNGDTPRW